MFHMLFFCLEILFFSILSPEFIFVKLSWQWHQYASYLLRIYYQRELHSIAHKIWSKVIVIIIFLGGIWKKYDGECPVEKEFKTSLNWVKPYLSWQPKPISPPPRIKDKWMHLQLCAISWLEKVVIANDWLLKCNAHFRLQLIWIKRNCHEMGWWSTSIQGGLMTTGAMSTWPAPLTQSEHSDFTLNISSLFIFGYFHPSQIL